MNMFINEQFLMNMFNDERFLMNMVFDERLSMNMFFDERFSVERRPTQISPLRACQATLHAGQRNLFSLLITVVQRFGNHKFICEYDYLKGFCQRVCSHRPLNSVRAPTASSSVVLSRLTTHYSLLTTHYSLLTTHYSLLLLAPSNSPRSSD
jgi:hypothetical protein